jgi:phosphoglycolate phosphatase-like HAD superfamily hydrolase
MNFSSLLDAACHKRVIVFDYDGTLAYLAIDWPALRIDLSRRARAFGLTSTFRPLWPEMALVRDECGAEAVTALLAVIAEHERKGVIQQQARTEIVGCAHLIATTPGHRVPVPPTFAVFSANLHATVAAGVDALGLGSVISWIVGADDVTQWKPAPEGLLQVMRLAGCVPADILFIGDSSGDAAAARAAGVDFLPA